MTSTEYVYTLALEQGKWYFGTSKDLAFRIAQHWRGEGSKWTQKYRACRVVAVQECPLGQGRALETATVAALICEKGWRDVRGGGWTAVDPTGPPQFVKKLEEYSRTKKDQGVASSSRETHLSMTDSAPPAIEFVEDNPPSESRCLARMHGARKVEDKQTMDVDMGTFASFPTDVVLDIN
jgi:hypothetical protein